ncbi:MAG TPA: signal peptide peptidase SppA [Candidatus Krumholzibacteria bacterium]|nr:signal peptide peptidase SppA [Candidatus Krumholzibacteria bacterium]
MSKRNLVVSALVAMTMTAGSAAAASYGPIPSYYDHLNFNLTGPTALTEAVGGYANPSVYPMMPGAETEFYWSSYNGDALQGSGHWGTFIGLKNLGFGFVHSKADFGNGQRSVTDYRIGLGAGTRRFSTGIGYGWAGGDTDVFGRQDFLQLGLTGRFGRYASVGANLNRSVETDAYQYLTDLALRPLGDDRLTVFGDMEFAYSRGDRIDNKPWSAGAMVEIPAGLKIIGRYFDDENSTGKGFSLGLAYSFGGGFSQGTLRGSYAPRFDSDNNLALTNWGVRFGFPERSTLLAPVFEGSGYLSMRIKGSPPYSRYRFFDSRMTFMEILTALDNARADDRVGGVALNLSGAGLSRGQAWEIRQRIEDLRTAGKKVVVFVDEFGMSTYYVASAADRIVMDPEGFALLPGYVLGRTYVANMAEKLGVGIEEWRFLKYKSAMEALVRHEMSEADREQRQALVDQYYATMREGIASGRNVSAQTVDRWVDDITMFTAQSAVEEKLVDEMGRWEEVKDAIKKLEGRKPAMVGPSQLDAEYFPSKQWGNIPEIAVVYAIGACAMDDGINARELEKTLRRLRSDGDVKAIVLRVDSPGGSPVASDVVAGQLRRCMEKKPVVISQGDVAASGGYWLSMCSNQIVAQPTTITGSIGVISGWAWDKGIGEKMGMEGDFVSAGKHADLFFSLRPPVLPIAIPHRQVTDAERETVLANMKVMYRRFVAGVAKGRGMTSEQVEEIAQGRVWTGLQARSNGLVDRIGGLTDAIMVARELAGISPDDEVDVREYGPRGLTRFHIPSPGFSFAMSTGSTGPIEAMLQRWLLGGESAPESAPDATYLDDYSLVYLRQLMQNNGRAQCLLPPDEIPQDGSRAAGE